MITHDATLAEQLPRQIRVLDGDVVSDRADQIERQERAVVTTDEWAARAA